MEFVSDQKRADQLLDKWLSKDNSRAFYLDFEADNFHHYEEVLCTAQICYGGEFFLFDAISLDLSGGFSEVLRTKPLWLHGCDYDLYLLERYLGVTPQLLFDTQIAARLCGFRKFGYASLVEAICGKKLPKDSQRADWTKRPLPEKMIKYAENDVRYLPQISDLLVRRLEKLKRLSWFEESTKALVENNNKSRVSQSEDAWRVQGAHALEPAELNFLKCLYEWRDNEAKKADRPFFKVLNNQTLLDWSSALAIGGDVSIPDKMRSERRGALHQAIDSAKSCPEGEWPEKLKRQRAPRVKLDEEALQEMITKRDEVADQLNLEASCIASRKILESIVKNPDEAQSLLNWQRELLEL